MFYQSIWLIWFNGDMHYLHMYVFKLNIIVQVRSAVYKQMSWREYMYKQDNM